jgi:hypothetical protein
MVAQQEAQDQRTQQRSRLPKQMPKPRQVQTALAGLHHGAVMLASRWTNTLVCHLPVVSAKGLRLMPDGGLKATSPYLATPMLFCRVRGGFCRFRLRLRSGLSAVK